MQNGKLKIDHLCTDRFRLNSPPYDFNLESKRMIEPNISVLGIDMGGTKIKAGLVKNGLLETTQTTTANSSGTESEVLEKLFELIHHFDSNKYSAIGVGVPSVVDIKYGIVYNVQNIPSWKEVHLKSILENKFNVPVFLNNDANVFVLGEKYFGKGKPYDNIAGVTLGTGLGTGLVLNGHLFCGKNCSAGEFGNIQYEDGVIENYSSGQFFKNDCGLSGEEVFKKANTGDQNALRIFSEYGYHLGNAVKTIVYAVDPEIIIFGGSVAKAFEFFKESLLKQFHTLVFPKTAEKLIITVSNTKDVAVLGAAALSYENG